MQRAQRIRCWGYTQYGKKCPSIIEPPNSVESFWWPSHLSTTYILFWRPFRSGNFLSTYVIWHSSVQFSSVALSCLTLCDPMISACQASLSITFAQTHVHQVRDAIQLSHPWSSPSPPAPNPSQHQSLFQWVNSLHEVAKVLELQLQHHSFQRNPRVDLLQNGLIGPPCSPKDSQESSPTLQFKSINSSALSLLYSPTLSSIHDHWKTIALTRRTLVGKVMSLLLNMLCYLGWS